MSDDALPRTLAEIARVAGVRTALLIGMHHVGLIYIPYRDRLSVDHWLGWESWSGDEGQEGSSPVEAFALLWDSIHGPGAWSANERVWAISFEVRHGNIGEVAHG